MKKSLLLILFLLAAFSVDARYADVNGDGEVTAADITALYDYLLNNDTSQLVNGDVNGDGVITAYDITAVYNELLNNVSDEYDNDYWTVFEDVDTYLDNNPDATYDQIIQYLTKYGNRITTTIEDGVLFVKTRDGRPIHLDLNGTYALSDSPDGHVDDEVMNQVIADIEAALGDPDVDKAPALMGKSGKDTLDINNNATYNASTTVRQRILTRRNILVWAPWNHSLSVCDSVQKIANKNKISFNAIKGRNCTLPSLSNFSNYDIVVLDCHGTKSGEIVLPMFKEQTDSILDEIYGKKCYSFAIIKNGNGKKEYGVIPNLNKIKGSFPKDLSKTILWTIMCHAYTNTSVIKYLADEANAADFYGANASINGAIPLGYLKEFIPRFYNGATSEKAFKAIEENTKHQRSIEYTMGNVTGKYSMRAMDDVIYQAPKAVKPRGNHPRGALRIDPNLALLLHLQEAPSLKSGDSGDSGLEAGFWFKKKATGEETHVPFNQSSIEDVQVSNYGDLIEQYVIEGNLDALDCDTCRYEYRTYLKVDDDYYYSNETYDLGKAAYAVLKDSTLTFYYDDKQGEREGTVYRVKEKYTGDNNDYPEWIWDGTIAKVIFDESFYDYKPSSTAYWFWCNLKTIENLCYLNTSNVTDMHCMFCGCNSLTSLDLSSFDTSKVTDMNQMFIYCRSLTSLDLSSFDTSNVTSMYCMFRECESLTSLDLSSFDTSNVTNMSDMFYICTSLTSLDLSSFDTSNVTSMNWMFSGCSSLTSLDLSSFDTSKVTSMYSMFNGCSSLTSLDLSNFDTSKVTGSMSWMFSSCTSLTSLDLSNFDTSKVTGMNWMFSGCSSLTSLDLSSFDTSNVTGMSDMFYNCTSLTSLDLSNFDTSNVTNMGSMFYNCTSLTSLDLSSFDTSNVTSMYSMFNGCSSLTSLDLSSFDTSNVTNMNYMFEGCSSLTTIYAGNWNYVSYSIWMFEGCNNLRGGQGTKVGSNNGYDNYGNPLYYYCSPHGYAAHIDGGKDWPGLFTGK
ncbi:MAG: BspA family leucine-rich repeat surface protein [Muribaculaceae bacterium]|nr:BspA family leucine-rich repeat surface protein [Muribaculaceae bacterium]